MRAQRRAAILALIREHAPVTDRELAEATSLSKAVAGQVRRELVAEGLVEAVKATEGSHYPIVGWQAVR